MPDTTQTICITGHEHPTLACIENVVNYFISKGFSVALGPEIESEWYNFDFLRVPAHHPSRDTQDTFWISQSTVLRTQTSAIQGRVTKDWNIQPPLRVISPGRVFRNESTDASHESVFHQLEGFVIDTNITMAHLLSTIDGLLNHMFGEIPTKYYPHHFEYVEPGMEVVIKWKDSWLEVLGCGMIHPEVLSNMGIDSSEYSGFAFGLGADRLSLLKYGINDIRSLYHPDARIIRQI
ncbi:phenylalanine--tRNA ligase subunit alpha [Candidatus Berkelbacteria bacterium]|nr:phenylalanine--tRNA ligase subunit alpha [Candidatus Berkelbacteria bacterium]